MSWSRLTSNAEELMVTILRKKRRPMSLNEIIEEIQAIDPTALTGRTPRNSLYSVVYRRERRRAEHGERPLFKTIVERREVLYSLNT